MADYTGGASSGAMQTQDVVASQVLAAQRQQQMAAQAMQMQAALRALAARGPAMQQLYGAMGSPPGMPPAQVPAPPPGSLSPGGGNPQVVGPQGAPPPQMQAGPPMQGPQPGMVPPPPGAGAPSSAQAGGPAPAQQQPIAPFRPMPTQPAQGPGAPAGVPPPPAAQEPAQDQVVPPAHIDIRSVIQQMQKQGVPPDKAADMLDQMMPVIQQAQQQELNFFKAQTSAQAAAIKAYQATMHAQYETGRLDVARREADRKREQGDANIAIKREKEARLKASAGAAAGGTANLKTSEYIYPKGADGRPDETQAPIGVRGITKTGRIITLDAEGKPTTALAGGTAKEAKDTKDKGGGASATVRANLVRGSATNALRLLDEVEKKYPNATTSSYFGYHADNPLSKGLAAGAKGLTMSQKDREIDATWAGIIEEVGPVLSGGLRNSDAFRRFLIDQAPALGDDAATVKRKIKILRENVDGSSKAFFNKFATDPKMWGEGVTKEQIAAAQGGGAGAAAAQQFTEGQTATNDKGEKIVFKGGKWQPAQ